MPDGTSGNLLEGRSPFAQSGMRHAERLGDGMAAPEGEGWRSDRTARFDDGQAFVAWDLGTPTRVRGAWLQGDNNDTYALAGSLDGVRYTQLWQAGPVAAGGLRARSTRALDADVRYLKLTAAGGDGAYGVAELQVFADAPRRRPRGLALMPGVPSSGGLEVRVMLFGLALALFGAGSRRGSSHLWLWALGALSSAAFAWLAVGIWAEWPAEPGVVSLVRATMAAVAALLVAREGLAPARWQADARALLPALGVAAAVSVACFYDLGHPQFYDQARDRTSFVHYRDLRVYYPSAKYFRELGYDGVYLASVAAEIDDEPASSVASLGEVKLRDLRTHVLTTVREASGEIERVRDRFEPARWSAFVADMHWFRAAMGEREYLDSLRDHGANATPLWMALAHVLYGHTAASHEVLLVGALCDPILLGLMFLTVGFTFGWRTMLVSLVVFGASDLYMFGSDWAGATLRHDWMAALGFGACALRRRWWVLGGALLAWAALIRAFPVLALVAVAFPALQRWRDERRRLGAWPGLSSLRVAERPTLRVFAGAALCVAAAWLGSSLLLGFGAWPAWLRKVMLLEGGMHVNHLGLRSLFGLDPAKTWAAARQLGPEAPLALAQLGGYGLTLLAYLGVAFVAARRMRPERAALLGLALIPIVFYPANYYVHCLFLLALLAREGRAEASGFGERSLRGRAVWVVLLAMCVAEYATVGLVVQQHFRWAAVVLFCGLSAVLLLFFVAARRMRPERAAPAR